MASELGVQTIQHTNGTDALTIDSSGRIIQSQRLYVLADISQTAGTNVYVTHSGSEAIKFGYVVEGTSSLLNTTTFKFQAPVAGLYILQAALHFNSGPFQSSFHQNDTLKGINWTPTNGTQHTSFTFNCAAGDQCHIESDGSEGIFNGGGSSGSNRYTWATWSKVG